LATVERAADERDEGKREEIIRRAAEMMARNGPERTSMRDVATTSGLGKASVYHYFASKEELIAGILDEGIASLLEDAEAILHMDDPVAALRELLHAHVVNHQRAEVVRASHVIFLMQGHALAAASPALSGYMTRRRRYEHIFVEIIQHGQQQGVFVEGDARMLTYAVLGIYNWMIQWFVPGGRVGAERIHEILCDFALRGLGYGALGEVSRSRAPVTRARTAASRRISAKRP
jgi:AcrR family transcriptional regulator